MPDNYLGEYAALLVGFYDDLLIGRYYDEAQQEITVPTSREIRSGSINRNVRL